MLEAVPAYLGHLGQMPQYAIGSARGLLAFGITLIMLGALSVTFCARVGKNYSIWNRAGTK